MAPTGVSFAVSVVLKAIDRASSTFRGVESIVARVNKPLLAMQNRVTELSERAGFPRLRKAGGAARQELGALGSAVSGQVAWLLRLSAAAGGVVLGTYAMVRGFANLSDELAETSEKTGVGVEALQEYRHAAALTDVANDALTSSLGKLARTIELARRGGEAQQDTFRRLRIPLMDANDEYRTLEQILPDVADRFAAMTDPVERIQLAVELFGKSGMDMIPMLAGGSKGLASMAKEARRLGVVLDQDTIKRGAELADQLDRVKAAIVGVRNVIAVALLPVVTDLAHRFEGWLVENRENVARWARSIAARVPQAIDQIGKAIERAQVLLEPFLAFWRALEQVLGPVGAAIALVAVKITLSLVPAIVSTITALTALSGALIATPAGWVILALVGVVAVLGAVAFAVYRLHSRWDDLSKAMPRGARAIEVAVGKLLTLVEFGIGHAMHQLDSALFALVAIPELILNAWDGVSEFFANLWDSVELRFSQGVKFVTDKVAALNGIVPSWLSAGAQVVGSLASANVATQSREIAERAGVIAAQSVNVKSEAAVSVDFNNLPRGTAVTPQRSNGVDLNLGLGYSMAGP